TVRANGESKEPEGISRRQLLGGMGAAAGAIAVSSAGMVTGAKRAGAAAQGAGGIPHSLAFENFGRIFPKLPPFAVPSDALRAALLDIGKPGGVLDAKDKLSAGPEALITDPRLSRDNPNNPTHTAGVTFLGQFIDHDITFDASSALFMPTPPEQTKNYRTPALDLDSLYGTGLVSSQLLYNKTDR